LALLDDANELARLREGLLAMPRVGCTVVPPVEETMVHWENIRRLLGVS